MIRVLYARGYVVRDYTVYNYVGLYAVRLYPRPPDNF